MRERVCLFGLGKVKESSTSGTFEDRLSQLAQSQLETHRTQVGFSRISATSGFSLPEVECSFKAKCFAFKNNAGSCPCELQRL